MPPVISKASKFWTLAPLISVLRLSPIHKTFLFLVSADNSQTINSASPIKYMVFLNQRSDAEDRNDWNNYTNWIYEDVPPSSREYKNVEVFYNNLNLYYNYQTILCKEYNLLNLYLFL